MELSFGALGHLIGVTHHQFPGVGITLMRPDRLEGDAPFGGGNLLAKPGTGALAGDQAGGQYRKACYVYQGAICGTALFHGTSILLAGIGDERTVCSVDKNKVAFC